MKSLMKYSLMSLFASALLVSISGCSSGGGDDGGSATINPVQSVSSGVASLSGTIATATSGISASSAFKATAAVAQDSTASATLIVDSNGNGKYGDSGDALLSSLVKEDGSFDFGEINVNKKGEVKAELTVSKEGYAPYTKIVTLSDGTSLSVIADAASTPLLVEAVDIATLRTKGTLASSFLELGTKRTSQGLVSYSTVRSLDNIIAMADVPLDADTQTKTVIPLSALGDGVTTITADSQSFDPTNMDDVENFPGNYVGVGEPGQGEQRLVSVGFDYLALKDQNGDPVELDINRLNESSKLLPQAVDYTSCLRTSIRYLNSSQLELFKKYGDDDTATNEFEIPLWYYNSSGGNWQYLGQAEVYEDRDLSVDYNVSSSATSAYAKMCITENWGTSVNLDYSFAPEKPTNVCVVAKDQDNNPVTHLSITAQKDTARDTKYLNQEGKASLALLAGNDVSEYTFSYQGTLTGWSSVEVQSSEIISGDTEDCNSTINIEVVNPYSATLQVTAKELDGSVAANKYVKVYNTSVNDYFQNSVYTDENGYAEFKVKPSTNYGVSYKGTTVDVNINATTLAPETADNGRIASVTVQETEKTPDVDLYMNRSSVSNTANSVNFHVNASDVNGDAITLSAIKLNGVALQEGTDYEVLNRYSYPSYDNIYAKLLLDSATLSAIAPQSLLVGNYSLEATYSDGKGNGVDSQRFTVNANRAPVISTAYFYNDLEGWTYINRKINPGVYDIELYAYDPDADTINFTYVLDGTLLSSKNNVSLSDGSHTLEVNATDGTLTDSKRFEFFVGNNPPVITSFGASKNSVDLASADKTIKLFAYAQDRDRDDLTVETTDGSIVLNPSYSGSNYFRSDAITIDANTTFTIYANDGDKNSSAVSIDITTYRANQAPVFTTELTALQLERGASHEFSCEASDPEDGSDVTYRWFVGDTLQANTSTTFTYTFGSSGSYVISCEATDSDSLEPMSATTSASVTVYDPSASGTLGVTTLPGALVATHNTNTYAILETKVAGDDGRVTFSVAGSDRVTFSVSVGPNVAVNSAALWDITLSEVNMGLKYACDSEYNDNVPLACATFNTDTFSSSTSVSVALVDVYLGDLSGVNASTYDLNQDGVIDASENYTRVLNESDTNSDGTLTWSEQSGSADINSEFFVNVPVRDYEINVDAYSNYHYQFDDYVQTPITINFSGFTPNSSIYMGYQALTTDGDGNVTYNSMLGSYDGLYTLNSHYTDENNVTRHLNLLDQTPAQVASLSFTPADFTLSESALRVDNIGDSSLYVHASYKEHQLGGFSTYDGTSGYIVNDSRLSYGLMVSENSTDPLTGASVSKTSYNYYGDGTLQSVYDVLEYPQLNIVTTFNDDESISFAGSDLSKLTYSSIRMYGYGPIGNTYANVNVRFNFTVLPTTLSAPNLNTILPGDINNSLPESYTNESIYVELSELKGVSETEFIDSLNQSSYQESYDTIGTRGVNITYNLSQMSRATLIDSKRADFSTPFSLGITPKE